MKTTKEFVDNANDSSSSAFFLNPYIQTGLFIGECINLDMSLVGGLIKLTEKAGCYKDRYSCVSYANWVVTQFDQSLLRESDVTDDWTSIMGVTQVY